MQHKEIDINGQRIAYYESGEKGQPVLFIHANSMSSLCFKKQLESPLGERYRIIAIDLPGHGNSEPALNPNEAYTVPGYAAIIIETAKQLRLNNPLFAGFCMGGNILLEAADDLQAAAIAIFGTPPVEAPSSIPLAYLPNPAFPLCFKEDLTDDDVEVFCSALFKSKEDIPDFFREDVRRSDRLARKVLGESIAPGGFKDEIEVLGHLKIPIAVILGESDGYVNRSYVESLNIPTLWRGDIQIIPDAGHAPHWEQPMRFNALLEEFIEDVVRMGT